MRTSEVPTSARRTLGEADLRGADFSSTDLIGADLRKADLRGALLAEAAVIEADLSDADLSGADLTHATLLRTRMERANLSVALAAETVFADVDLSETKALDTCSHRGASIVDHRTLLKSGLLPTPFLRGCGLPDTLIDYLASILIQPIQFYSFFISYATSDQDFATRLHADLQDKGVRCWFAPEDMKTGAKILDTIDQVIRVHDKLLVILSEHSVASDWVEDEVTRAFAEERSRKETVLFSIRVDDAVMDTSEAWAVKLKDNRHIGDFTRWKEHDAYSKALERLLRDLKVEKG